MIAYSISVPIGQSTSIASGASHEAWTRALAQGDSQHPEGGVETEREMSGADVAEPEVFTSPEFPPVAVESSAEVGGKSLRQKQLAFVERTEGNRADGVGTFLKHGSWIQSSLLWSFGQRDFMNRARKGPNCLVKRFEQFTLDYSELNDAKLVWVTQGSTILTERGRG